MAKRVMSTNYYNKSFCSCGSQDRSPWQHSLLLHTLDIFDLNGEENILIGIRDVNYSDILDINYYNILKDLWKRVINIAIDNQSFITD